MICSGITYNNIDNKITIQYNENDGIKGETFSNPYTFKDIYDTDIANGWGVVNILETHYILYSEVFINAYFYASGLTIECSNNTHREQFTVDTYFQSEFNQCVFIRSEQDIVKFYGTVSVIMCAFYDFGYVNFYGRNIDECVVSYSNLYNVGRSTILSNVKIEYVNYIDCMNSGTIISYNTNNTGIRFINGRSLYLRNTYEDLIFKNLENINTLPMVIAATIGTMGLNRSITFIDSDVDPTNYSLVAAFNGELNIYYKNTFIWKIENNINIKLLNNMDNVIINEIVNFDDSNEILYSDFYLRVDNNIITNDDLIIYQPFKLIVSKEGYDDLIIEDINVTPGQPTIIRGELVNITFKTQLYGSTLYNTNIY
jgi:hypothetical protein